MDHFLKSLLNLLQYCFCFMFWFFGLWDLSSLTRDQTHTLCIGRQSLNHWTSREVPLFVYTSLDSLGLHGYLDSCLSSIQETSEPVLLKYCFYPIIYILSFPFVYVSWTFLFYPLYLLASFSHFLLSFWTLSG